MLSDNLVDLLIEFDEMGFCPTTLCENAEEYAIDWRNDMKEAIAKHEQDLLKEFVEWLKDRFDSRIDEQTAKCERIESEGDDGTYLTSYEEFVAHSEGILTGFVNAKWWLEELDTIEKFLEEKDEKTK